jgi:tripartite motif-containing protein 71
MDMVYIFFAAIIIISITNVVPFAVSGELFKFLEKWASKGTENGQFNVPHSMAFDKFGNSYITDTDNNRVQKFSSDGVFIKKWGIRGSGDGEFRGPEGIDVDSSGNVYVADTGNSRVQIFSSDG